MGTFSSRFSKYRILHSWDHIYTHTHAHIHTHYINTYIHIYAYFAFLKIISNSIVCFIKPLYGYKDNLGVLYFNYPNSLYRKFKLYTFLSGMNNDNISIRCAKFLLPFLRNICST